MGSLRMRSKKIHYNQPYPTTGEEKRSSSRTASTVNDNKDDNTRIGPLPLEEEYAATRTESGPWLGTGHSSRSRTPIGTSDGRFRGGGAGAEDNGRPVATGNGCTVNDKGNLVPWVDLRHCKQ